jgi:hypothetical protein
VSKAFKPEVWRHRPGLKTSTIVVDRCATHIQHLELRRGHQPAIELIQTPTPELTRTFVHDPQTPVDVTAELWKQHAVALGASSEALAVIGRFVNITEEEAEMATARSAPPKKEAKGPPPKAVKPEKPTKEPKAAAPKEPKEKKPSAASRFQELILKPEGRTDDEIFAAVQKEFGLPDEKRSYVSWYRNYLKKQGKAPPPAVEPKGEAKPTKETKAPAAKVNGKAAAAPAKAGPPKKKG